MKKLLTLALLSLLFACKEDKFDPDNLIVGKWRLISYCKPTGTNSCDNTTVPDSKRVFVEFSSKGSFTETYKSTIPVEYAFLGCGGGGYEMENGDVRIRALCMSSSNGQLIKIKSLTDKQLILMPFGTGE
ncbi:lipocalin family protein [Massilia pinisoli]|uniref:lipocalin family protein n=1 Tax=Massilia pinisoli TaxID=1772194 RepID=UPI00363384EF